MNPLTSIWFKPRKTFRYLIDEFDPVSVWILAVLEGFKESLNWATSFKMGERHDLSFIFLVVLISGPIIGIVGNWLIAFFASWTGRMFGGKGSWKALLTAAVWGSLPVILLAPFTIWLSLEFGEAVFSQKFLATVIQSGNPKMLFLEFSFWSLKFIATIWGFILTLVGISEAQGFTKWNAFANMVVAGLLKALHQRSA